MKLRFWRKNKWTQTPSQTLVVPPGKYTISYTITSDAKSFNSSTVVYPTIETAPKDTKESL